MRSVPPGRCRRFRGNEYEALAIARHRETEEAVAAYRALCRLTGETLREMAGK